MTVNEKTRQQSPVSSDEVDLGATRLDPPRTVNAPASSAAAHGAPVLNLESTTMEAPESASARPGSISLPDLQGQAPARELTVESTHMTGVELPGAGEAMEATMDVDAYGAGGMQGSQSRDSVSCGSRSEGSAGSVRRLEPGTRVGRYLVVECIGEGAMGQVYAAFDPELDRKVALKIMNAGVSSGSSKGSTPSSPGRRLMREAKALSQLAHPNVVSVFDVGSLGEEIFVAMEFVAGTDLRRWSKEKPRSWKEVLEVYLQAGLGLAAAHAAGLVHRDFKPHNAILGEDGRVRVLDFGLATPRSAAHHAKAAADMLDKPIERSVSRSGGNTDAWERLTQTGSLLGTPAYMAPEVIAGQGADEKSDQFSFAVSMFQGLYECLPFSGKTLREIADSIKSGHVAEPAGHHVPGWLRKALLKGLNADPARRFPSMQDMLTVLMRQDPASVRARWAARIGAGVAAMVVVGVGVAAVVERNAQVCRGAERRLDGLWDEGRGKQVEAALLATGLPYAPDTWTRVKDGLDGYARGWAAMHTEACEATHVRGEQSGEMLDLRMRCLQDRLGEVKALVDVLVKADKEIVPTAVPAVNSLLPLSVCADAEMLRTAVLPPRDPAVRVKVEELRERLEQARALERTGKYADGMTVVEALEKEVLPLNYEPLTAEMLLMKGILLSQRGKYQEGATVLEQADTAASHVKHVQVSAQALRALVHLVGYQLRRFDEGFIRAHYALSFLNHNGLMDKYGDRLLAGLGSVMIRKGEYDKAIEYTKQAISLCEKQYPTEQCHNFTRSLGIAYYFAGRYEEAEPLMQQTIRDAEKVLGPAHPDLAKGMNNYNMLLTDMGRYEEALQWMKRALEIYEQAYGKEHAMVSDARNNLGNTYWWMLDYQQALKQHQQALDIRLKVFGPDHAAVASSHHNVGSDHDELGNLELAKHHIQRCVELRTRLMGAEHTETIGCRNNLGHLLLKERKIDLAQAELDTVIAVWTRLLGADHPNLCEAYMYRAEVALARGDHAKARALLEHTLKIHKEKRIENKFTARAHLELAKALWAIPGATSKLDAVAHAGSAAQILARFGWVKSSLQQELNAWMEAHKL